MRNCPSPDMQFIGKSPVVHRPADPLIRAGLYPALSAMPESDWTWAGPGTGLLAIRIALVRIARCAHAPLQRILQ